MEDLNKIEIEALRHIRNSLIHTGNKPTYRKLMELLGYKSPRSINQIIHSLIKKRYLLLDENNKINISENVILENQTETIDIPLIGQIACGQPNFAEENFERFISVSTMLAKPPYKYFILRARGDSMDKKGIKEGTLVLIRQQATARNGEVVAGLINNECTLKEFYREQNFIILKPNSTNSIHEPIILTSDFTIMGVQITNLPDIE
ncbi:MAG TPA: transcriptional repressor LexA [Ignavibacteria bacterium]